VTASNLLLLDDDLHPVAGDGMPNPSTRFHLWIYRARPDVSCILPTHPPHVSALSMLGEELAVAHMDATMFFEDCAHLPGWPGVPFGDEEDATIIQGARPEARDLAGAPRPARGLRDDRGSGRARRLHRTDREDAASRQGGRSSETKEMARYGSTAQLTTA